MIGKEINKALINELEKLNNVVDELVDAIPKEKKALYFTFFEDYKNLLLEGRNVEAEALANKFKKENGN